MSVKDKNLATPQGSANQPSLSDVMTLARADRGFMDKIILVVQECDVDDRTLEENALLEWARSFQRQQVSEDE